MMAGRIGSHEGAAEMDFVGRDRGGRFIDGNQDLLDFVGTFFV